MSQAISWVRGECWADMHHQGVSVPMNFALLVYSFSYNSTKMTGNMWKGFIFYLCPSKVSNNEKTSQMMQLFSSAVTHFVDGLIEILTGWLIDWLIDWLVDWLDLTSLTLKGHTWQSTTQLTNNWRKRQDQYDLPLRHKSQSQFKVLSHIALLHT